MRLLKIHKKTVLQVILQIIIWILIFILLFPLMFTLWNAFKSHYEYTMDMWLPSLPIRFSNLGVAFGYIKDYLFNTVLVALVGCIGMLIISSVASYSIARIRFPGSKFCFAFVLMLMMMPGIITLVPQFLLYKALGLFDNFWALIFPIYTNGSLMSVFLFVTFFRGLPSEIFEAADIDGADTAVKYLKIALPLSLPILGTAAIIQIVSIWNDYLWQQVIMTEPYTIAAGLIEVFDNNREFDTKIPVVYSGYLIASSPLIILFVAANKYYIQGLVGSAIKM